MSDDEHSESEFYYPDELQFHEENEVLNEGSDRVGAGQHENNNSQEEIEAFVNEQKSKNTARKTASDLNTFQRYLASIDKGNVQLLYLPAGELDHLLAKFFKDVRKINGEEYEPDTLSGFQRSIQRFLSDGKYPSNILVDKEFEKSRQVLAAKRKNLVQKAGKGNKPNATRSLTDEEEDKLFRSGQFGSSSPEALQRTMWWFLSLHYGFRARDESRKLCWGDVELQQDPVQDGREMLVWLNERGTKTRKGQENGHQRAFQPKIYATNTERCPIRFYKLFKSHRPEEMNQPDSPFFLAVRHGSRREKSKIWYMKAPLGKNQIGKFLSSAAENAGIQRTGAKVSNHSVRKTSISRLLDANTPENFVAQLSGHKNTQSLQSYKSASEQHQRQMSHILSRTQEAANQSLPDSNSVEFLANETSTITGQSMKSVQQVTTTHSLAVTQASNQLIPVTPDANSRAVFAGANISSISGCQFQIFNGPVKIIQGAQKRRRAVIESDDED